MHTHLIAVLLVLTDQYILQEIRRNTECTMLVVLAILLPVWITASSAECGLAPHVNLNCTNGNARVEWAPSASYCAFGCKAYWTCDNGTGAVSYRDESGFWCNSNGWNFIIPWDHYFCNVTVNYEYFSYLTSLNERSPETIKSCLGNSIELQSEDHVEVGRPYRISCILNTGKILNHTELNISWTGPNGVVVNDSDRITIIPATSSSDGHIHTSALQFLYISEDDENTSYDCTASLFGEQEPLFKSLTMINITIPTPNVTVTALDDNPVIGKSFVMECNVVVARGISNVDIMWIINNTVKRNHSVNYTDWDMNLHYADVYTITELQLSDNNTVYYCKVVVNANTYGISSTTINNVIIVHPNVSVTSLSSRPTVGEPLLLNCSITVIKGIVGDVDVIWTANGRAIKRVDNVVGHTIGLQEMLHSDVYEISKLQPCDNNTIYRCEAIIKTNAPLNGSDSIALTIRDTTPISNSTTFEIQAAKIQAAKIQTTTNLTSVSISIPTTDCNHKDSSFFPALFIFSSVVAVLVIALIACFIGCVMYIGKWNFKLKRTINPQEDKPVV